MKKNNIFSYFILVVILFSSILSGCSNEKEEDAEIRDELNLKFSPNSNMDVEVGETKTWSITHNQKTDDLLCFYIVDNAANAIIEFDHATKKLKVSSYKEGEATVRFCYRIGKKVKIGSLFSNEYTIQYSDEEYSPVDVKINFGYYKSYTARFYDFDLKIINLQSVKSNEKIVMPSIEGSEILWVCNNNYYKPNDSLKPKSELDFYPIKLETEYTDGLQFETNIDNSVKIVGYKGYDEKVIIPSYYNNKVVTSIANGAFKDKQIQEVIIPDSILSIGESCFENCDLEKISISKNSYLKTLGKKAFYNCSNLINIDLSTTKLESLFSYSFYKCSSMEYIFLPDSITKIESYAFGYCEKTIVLFESSYNPKTLEGCWYGHKDSYSRTYKDIVDIDYSVKEVKEDENFLYVVTNSNKIDILKFMVTSYLNDVNLVSLFDYEVNKLLNNSFKGTNLSSLKVPSSLISIGSSCFSNSSLQSIEFQDNCMLKEIGEEAFYNCTNLKNIDLSTTKLESLGTGSFYNCSSMEFIFIPKTINSISNYSFAYCKKTIVLFESSDNPKTLEGCWYGHKDSYSRSYKDIIDISYNDKYIAQNESFQYAVTNDDSIEILKYTGNETVLKLDYINGYQISKICSKVFYESKIQNVTIGKSIKYIDDYAFYNTSLYIINFEKNSELISIGDYAFAENRLRGFDFINCSSLKKIGSYCFKNNSTLYYLFANSLTDMGSYAFAYNNNAHLLFEGLDLSGISLGYCWNGHENSFSKFVQDIKDISYNIESVVDNDKALYAIRHDNKVTLLDARSEYLGDKDTLNIKTIDGYDIYKIANYAFRRSFSALYNTTVKHINIGSSIVEIGDYAFYECSNLKTVDFDDTNNKLKSIGDSCFSGCNNLRAIFLPKSLKSIGNSCFSSDTKCLVMFEISNNTNLKLGSEWNGYNMDFLIVQVKNSIKRSICDVHSWTYNETDGTGSKWEIIVNYNNVNSDFDVFN